MKMYQNMTQCDELIKNACNFSLSGEEKTKMEKCFKVMGEFRKETEACKESATNCTCWNELVKDIKDVKACNNIGNKANKNFSYKYLIIFSGTQGKGSEKKTYPM